MCSPACMLMLKIKTGDRSAAGYCDTISTAVDLPLTAGAVRDSIHEMATSLLLRICRYIRGQRRRLAGLESSCMRDFFSLSGMRHLPIGVEWCNKVVPQGLKWHKGV